MVTNTLVCQLSYARSDNLSLIVTLSTLNLFDLEKMWLADLREDSPNLVKRF